MTRVFVLERDKSPTGLKVFLSFAPPRKGSAGEEAPRPLSPHRAVCTQVRPAPIAAEGRRGPAWVFGTRVYLRKANGASGAVWGRSHLLFGAPKREDRHAKPKRREHVQTRYSWTSARSCSTEDEDLRCPHFIDIAASRQEFGHSPWRSVTPAAIAGVVGRNTRSGPLLRDSWARTKL